MVADARRKVRDHGDAGISDTQLARQHAFRHLGHAHYVAAYCGEHTDLRRCLEPGAFRADICAFAMERDAVNGDGLDMLADFHTIWICYVRVDNAILLVEVRGRPGLGEVDELVDQHDIAW